MISRAAYWLSRPWLWLPSQWSHDLAPYLMPVLARLFPVENKAWNSVQWRGLKFQNPMGIAGGVDKSGASLKAWSQLGAGFLEVGTVTPEPQGPNPGLIMDRDIKARALWNKMGFPNPGLKALQDRLQSLQLEGTPLFINVGKNRWTENSQAAKDYVTCIQGLHQFADAFVINVSSPNTKGLRDLLSEKELKNFLIQIREALTESAIDKPLLLKLSPDMELSNLENALVHSGSLVDGWILTNTTRQRYQGSPFAKESGGVSGAPLKKLSRNALDVAVKVKSQFPDHLLISAGGVDGAVEVRQRLQQGADLVQMYSTLVFQGPWTFSKMLKELQVTEN